MMVSRIALIASVFMVSILFSISCSVENISDPSTDFGTIYVKNSDGTPYEDSFIADLITVDLETLPE